MVINAKKQTISTGVIIDLGSDDATHLAFALGQAQKYCFSKSGRSDRGPGSKWPWLETFIAHLDAARGVGCTMGGRLTEEEGES